uniref:Uncharacterized protein n=1 Tax=Brassica oleracea TaxID=3712 RepID=A0A3P6FVX2_BRAOL|nr:unnamed protein product [Brassica oleracea]
MNLFLLLYLHVSIFTLLINSGSRWAAFRNILAEIFEALGLMVPNQKPSDAEEHLVGLSDDVGIGFIPDHGNQPSSSTVDRATDLTGQDETGVSKVIRADQKRFFFDLGNNNRGHFLKISEVLDELELVSKMLQVEQKLFYLDLKENPRGKYLKISEKTLGSKSTIIVPSSGISWCFNLIPLSVVGKHLEISARDYRSSNQPYGFSGFNIMATQISKKRKFVADGVFFAELNGVVLPLAIVNNLGIPLSKVPYQTGGEDELLPLKSLLARMSRPSLKISSLTTRPTLCNLAGESLVFPAFIYTSHSEAAENILPSSEGARGLTASSSGVAVVGKKV